MQTGVLVASTGQLVTQSAGGFSFLFLFCLLAVDLLFSLFTFFSEHQQHGQRWAAQRMGLSLKDPNQGLFNDRSGPNDGRRDGDGFGRFM